MNKYRFYFIIKDTQEWFIYRIEKWNGTQYVLDEEMNLKWKDKKINL